jgi:S1-C subfamily serine protease
MTAYFADLATAVRISLAYIPSVRAPGIIWDEAHIVTGPIPVTAAMRTVAVRTVSGERAAETTSSRRLPLSALELDPAAAPSFVRRAATPPRTGDWIVAVWQTDQAPAFAAATFGQMGTTTCGVTQVREFLSSTSLSRSMIGGGVFNMDRELLGVILPCDDHVAAIEPSGVDEMLKRAMTIEERVLAKFGVLFSSLTQDERRYFAEDDGLLAREVWTGTPAEMAGVRPGDLVMALNAQAVTVIDDLQPMMRSDEAFELQVRRGSRTETLRLDSRSATDASSSNATTIGLAFEPAAPTYRIESLLPGSLADRAGLKSGDRLLRINGSEPRSRAQAERTVTNAGSAPMLLEIQRDDRRIAVVIPQSTRR